MDGDMWKDYEPEINDGLDDAMAECMDECIIPGIWAWRNHTFIFNWRAVQGTWECHAYQRNNNSQKVRAIRRVTVVVDRG